MKQVFHIAFLFGLSSTTAFAFDNNRSGFTLGLGGGLHAIDMQSELNGSKNGYRSEKGYATTFRIGGGLNEKISLYYTREASWYNAANSLGSSAKNATYVVGLSGLGLSYFLSEKENSPYVIGALGLGDSSTPFENAYSSSAGTAWLVGVGYEFKEHISVEAKLLSTKIERAGSVTLHTDSPVVTFNYTWY